ncbi:MAG: methyltransferase, partial [Candidatus Planktophila sp.]
MSPLPRVTLEQAFAQAIGYFQSPETIGRVVLSGRRRNMQTETERIDIRPVEIKGALHFQVSTNDGKATTTKNYLPGELPLSAYLTSGYSNVRIDTLNESFSLQISKKDEPVITVKAGKYEVDFSHDSKKDRLLNPSDPFLIEVGISDASGKVKTSKMDKYMQVEEFLRLLTPTLTSAIEAGHLDSPVPAQPLKIVDLGCGHAYLTFATHQYLKSIGMSIKVIGIDVRSSSRDRNNEIAKKLGISGTIEFRAEEISQTSLSEADVAIALHACDTATDDAIAWALRSDAQ